MEFNIRYLMTWCHCSRTLKITEHRTLIIKVDKQDSPLCWFLLKVITHLQGHLWWLQVLQEHLTLNNTISSSQFQPLPTIQAILPLNRWESTQPALELLWEWIVTSLILIQTKGHLQALDHIRACSNTSNLNKEVMKSLLRNRLLLPSLRIGETLKKRQ